MHCHTRPPAAAPVQNTPPAQCRDTASAVCAVVDVYSSNWGPCDMLVGHFSNLYFELSEKLSFGFARAAADTVPVLKDLAGAAAPTFLFFLDGKEVARIVGPRMTEIKAKINELSPKL